MDDTSGGGEEEAPLRQDPQQTSTSLEGRESEREFGEEGDGAGEVSQEGNTGTNKRTVRERSESGAKGKKAEQRAGRKATKRENAAKTRAAEAREKSGKKTREVRTLQKRAARKEAAVKRKIHE